MSSDASFFGFNGRALQRQYKDWLSEFKQWDQLPHTKDYLIFHRNMGKHLSMDETALSHGELYTVITNNKAAKGKSKSIIAMIAGTSSEKIIEVLLKLPQRIRDGVEEITLDIAPNMMLLPRDVFQRPQLLPINFIFRN